MKHRTPPPGTTHLEWTSEHGGTCVIAPIDALADWMAEKGSMRFGVAVGDTFRPHEGEPSPAPRKHPEDKPLVQRERGDAAKPLDDKHPHWKGREPEAAPAFRVPPKAPAAPKAPRAPRAAGGESVCGFIDNLIAEGGRTKEQLADLVLAKWPERDRKSTLSTIGVRPSHMKAKGMKPQPFAK